MHVDVVISKEEVLCYVILKCVFNGDSEGDYPNSTNY